MTLLEMLFVLLGGVFSLILPVSFEAHAWFAEHVFALTLTPTLLLVIHLGVLICFIFFFFQDWLGFLSSGFLSLWERRAPRTPDERFFYFHLFSFLPILGCFLWNPTFALYPWRPIQAFFPYLPFVLFMILLLGLWSEKRNRHLHQTPHWNWKDALGVGCTQLTFLIPGLGRHTGVLLYCFLRNYRFSAIWHYLYRSFLPFLCLKTFFLFKSIPNFKLVSHPIFGKAYFFLLFFLSIFISFVIFKTWSQSFQIKRFQKVWFYRSLFFVAITFSVILIPFLSK